MKWANIKWIFLREVRDQLRDKRTLFTIAILPLLLYPLLGMTFLQVAQFQREHSTPVLVLGAASLPASPRLLEGSTFAEEFCPAEDARLLSVTVEDRLPPEATDDTLRPWAEQAIQSGRYDAVVYFPHDFAERLLRLPQQGIVEDASNVAEPVKDSEIPKPELFLNTANDKSRIAGNRLESVLRRFRDAIIMENLHDRRIPIAALKPFQVVQTDVAREHSRSAAVWSKILPFIVLVWALTGAFYPAVDLCAGEKERGTLETLLCSPAQRSEIVWGKLLTVMTFSMATSLLNLASMGLTGMFVISRMVEMGGDRAQIAIGSPPLSALSWLVLALLPLSAMFSALSLAIAAFARSSKEGQYYLMPLLMISLPLMMLPLMPSAELDWGMSLIPITGVMLLLRALIEGEYLEALRFAVPVIGVTALCCLLAVRWAVDQFNNESVLFRESERFGLGDWLRHVVRDRRDTPSLAEGILCGVLLLVIRFFATFVVPTPGSWSGFATTTMVTLIAFVAAPALLMAVMLTRKPAKTLLLRAPQPAVVPMAVLLAIVFHPAGFALAQAVQQLYPFSVEVQSQLKAFESLLQGAPNLWLLLLVLALTPAICEELAFRGFILSGLRHIGHKWVAILVASVFFGAAHGVIQQSLTACVVGLLLGYLAVQTGSLWPCILFHFVHNSLMLLVGGHMPALLERFPTLQHMVSQGEAGPAYRWPVIVVSLLLATATLQWFRRLQYERTPEESLQRALDHQVAAVHHEPPDSLPLASK